MVVPNSSPMFWNTTFMVISPSVEEAYISYTLWFSSISWRISSSLVPSVRKPLISAICASV